jgi:hypothetical protein
MLNLTEKSLKKIRGQIHRERTRRPNSTAKAVSQFVDSKGVKFIKFDNGRVEKALFQK